MIIFFPNGSAGGNFPSPRFLGLKYDYAALDRRDKEGFREQQKGVRNEGK